MHLIKINLSTKMVMSLLLTLLLTPFCIFIVYFVQGIFFNPIYSVIDRSFEVPYRILFSEAINNVEKWPWLRGSLAITSFTFLYPFFALWNSRGDEVRYKGDITAYGIAYIYLPIFMALFSKEVLVQGMYFTHGIEEALLSILLIIILHNIAVRFFAHVVWDDFEQRAF